MGDLTFSVLCVPYLAVGFALIVTGVVTVVLRGDKMIRLSLLTLAASAIPWAAGFVVAGCTTDPAMAELAVRVGIGTTGLVGPSLMMLILVISGRFDSYRMVLAVAFLFGMTSVVLCWTTNWTVNGVRLTPSGLLFPVPGWFQLFHVGQIPLWGITGVLISRRGMRTHRDRRAHSSRRRAMALIFLCIVTLFDSLLAHGIFGSYPVAWLPVLLAIGVTLQSILRTDLIRARGVDYPALVELVAMLLVTAYLYMVVWGGNRTWIARPLVTGMFLAPLPMLGLIAAWTLRIRRRRTERATDASMEAIDQFADQVRDFADERAVAAGLRELLAAHAPISDVVVWLVDDSGALRPVLPENASVPEIDARIRAWLIANAEPLVVAEVASTRLGGLRALVEELIERLDTDVVVPLVDRDSLVGVAVASLPAYRVLRDDERDFVRSAATAAARGLTFMALTREAGHLANTAREVELAEAVQHARKTGDVTVGVGPWQVLGHYRPAARVSGDVWSCADLGAGRLLIFAGDVVGRGVPSALVSAAVTGVCEAAPALCPDIEPRALLELAHRTVSDLGGGTQRVTAFAAILDVGRGVIRFATAGHRTAYLVRPGGDDERAHLDVLTARSTPLGDPTMAIGVGERPLGATDLLIACSESVLEVRDQHGDPWGDRRLQRLLRDQLIGAGDRAARMIVAAATAHAADAAVPDDLLVVVVRPAAPQGGAAP